MKALLMEQPVTRIAGNPAASPRKAKDRVRPREVTWQGSVVLTLHPYGTDGLRASPRSAGLPQTETSCSTWIILKSRYPVIHSHAGTDYPHLFTRRALLPPRQGGVVRRPIPLAIPANAASLFPWQPAPPRRPHGSYCSLNIDRIRMNYLQPVQADRCIAVAVPRSWESPCEPCRCTGHHFNHPLEVRLLRQSLRGRRDSVTVEKYEYHCREPLGTGVTPPAERPSGPVAVGSDPPAETPDSAAELVRRERQFKNLHHSNHRHTLAPENRHSIIKVARGSAPALASRLRWKKAGRNVIFSVTTQSHFRTVRPLRLERISHDEP